jgi:hypothetical protein
VATCANATTSQPERGSMTIVLGIMIAAKSSEPTPRMARESTRGFQIQRAGGLPLTLAHTMGAATCPPPR